MSNPAALLAGALGDATNLGTRRMAETWTGVAERQIMWASRLHMRAETCRAAQVAIVDAHAVHPCARVWGWGTASSSDGQFFRAADRAARRIQANARYGSEPKAMFYTHVPDQHGDFPHPARQPERERRPACSTAS